MITTGFLVFSPAIAFYSTPLFLRNLKGCFNLTIQSNSVLNVFRLMKEILPPFGGKGGKVILK